MRSRLPIILAIALLAASLPAHAAADEAAWTPVTPTPPLPDNGSGVLFDVAAVSPTEAWVVGVLDVGWDGIDEPLIEHWTGAGWQPVKAPSAPDFQYRFSAIDAVSGRDVWAVGNGYYTQSPDYVPAGAIVHYDGTTWSVSATPARPPLNADLLTDIDMISATDGWAVGWRDGPTELQPLVMRWRNGRWDTVSVPPVGGNARLEHVHARAGNDVWAVGSLGNGASVRGDLALVMHFDGTRWSRIEVPHGGAADTTNELWAVTAVSADEVWAVGDSCLWGWDSTVCQPLVLRLSQGVWQVVPTAGDHGTNLRDVVARSGNDVWVIGYDVVADGPEANHVEHWDGQRFATVPVEAGAFAVRAGLASALVAATRIPGTAELWAVGWQDIAPQVIRHG